MATRAKPDPGSKRVPLMVRTAPALRERLEAAANEAGRSLAQEAELRLERSFELVEVINRSMDSVARLSAQYLKEFVDQKEDNMLALAGGDDLFLIWFRLAHQVRNAEEATGRTIKDDEETRHLAERNVLSAIPQVFRDLPISYSELKAKSKTQRSGLSPLSELFSGLPPLGWKGDWPPTDS